MSKELRTVSGMRPTGPLHLGHYFGVLKNWVELQYTEEAYFFVADWHALTSDYADPSNIRTNIREMVKDWVGAGLDPCGALRASVELGPDDTVEVVFFLGEAADTASAQALLARYRPGDKVEVHAFRRDELRTAKLKLDGPEVTRYRLTAAAKPVAVSKAREAWLKG